MAIPEDAAMTTEQVTNLPETLAMLTLIATLFFLKRRKPQLPIDSWLIALGLLFLSHLSWYFARNSGPWHYATHTIRLTFDLAAAAILLLFTGRPYSETPRRSLIIICNLIPILAIEALYGADIAQPSPYIECCLIGSVVCIWVAIHLRRGFLIPLLQTLAFSSVGVFAFYGNYRASAYWCLGSVYLAAACHIWPRLRETPMGRATIVVSLLLWSASFFVHPWALHSDLYRQGAEQIWAMQKFFICIGMLVALLESEMRQTERLALCDELTGLPNRRFMERHLLSAIGQGRAQLILFDLNGFKDVNDTLGHSAGDEVLRQIAQRIQSLLDADDQMARVGGDEFTVISPHLKQSLPSAIHRALLEPILIDGHLVRVNASLGSSLFPEDTDDLEGMSAVARLLKVADNGMYKQKSRTPGRRSTDPRPI